MSLSFDNLTEFNRTSRAVIPNRQAWERPTELIVNNSDTFYTEGFD